MFNSTRAKLIFSFLSVALLVGAVSLIVGWQLLYGSVLNEANNRVRQDLNVARVIYDDRVTAIEVSLETTVHASDFNLAMAFHDFSLLQARLEQVSRRLGLDFAGILGADGLSICRLGYASDPPPPLAGCMPVAEVSLSQCQTVSGTVVLDQSFLESEPLDLAERSRILIRQERKDEDLVVSEETAGLAIASAVPIFNQGKLIGTLYGGMLLNRDQSIVDKIGGTVFRNEVYQGHNLGTVTIFFNNLRISTNVLEKDGQRAIGTLASQEVTTRVLQQGKKWTDRAFVVNDWYITAYEPITDINQHRVGMLYVGVLEAKYRDVRENALWVFAMITLAGVLFAIALGCLLASRIMRPVNQLIQASMEISTGNLSPDIGPICQSDIGLLQKEFKKMTEAIIRRDQEHQEESEKRLIQSEKQASIGNLAAGVAHEINNPLTPVLTFTHLLLRRTDLPEEVRMDLETIAVQTERVRKIVKGLLDFSRQSRLDMEFLDPRLMLEDCIDLMENQALICGVALHYNAHGTLPMSRLDRNQIQSVMVNIILNALDATASGGTIDIVSVARAREGVQGVEIRVQDTGMGIEPESLDKLFDPFFTTKEVGKGTGLGLAVSAGIIERHGGKISVESVLGEGSCFTLWLPCDRDRL
ncbi:cache domain-containing protein [Desulfoluna sp.]|uniref:sensor histidine kinase n=1 Tax=Desulfoluna sp. TaxID=2045199 RepID=UPI00262D7449|nr:cache domain-containing protein [Desulfoluna sp.]